MESVNEVRTGPQARIKPRPNIYYDNLSGPFGASFQFKDI